MNRKRLVCLLLISTLMIMAVACRSNPTDKPGSPQTSGTTNPNENEESSGGTAKGMEFPIVEEPITLKCFATYGAYNKGDFNELPIWKEYEKKTNIKVEFEAYPMGDHTEKFSLKMATNDLPDFFMKVSLSNSDITKYAQEGSLVPITPYLEDYAPNYFKQVENDSNLKATVTNSDGNIYGFAYLVTSGPAQTRPIFINEKWLGKLGEKVPSTTDELKQLLIKVRDADLNGNGKADEIPLISNNVNLVDHMFRGSFGVGSRGYTNIDIDPEGNLRYIPTSDEYKQLLVYLNELYTEKLIYQEIFDGDLAALAALGEQNQVFMATMNLRSYLGETYKENFGGIYEPFEGPNGDKVNSLRQNTVSGQNTFITADNPYPEATVRWIDYFYSEEGIRLYFMGIEGETYEFDSEGIPRYTDLVAKNPEGLTSEEVLGKYLAWGGGSNPSIAEDTCFGNIYPELEKEITQSLLQYAPDEVWGPFTYSMEDTTRLATLEQDINTYVTDMKAKFITGNTSFGEWDSYKDTLNKMGFDELMQIYQRGLDDYNSKVK